MQYLLFATLLGVIEGLTEFIPVSSTGHLILSGSVLTLPENIAASFDVFIQLGAILAVVVLYPGRFKALIPDSLTTFPKWSSLQESSFTGWAGLYRLALACLPAFVLGALFHSTIKEALFAPLPVAGALFAGGVMMIFAERRPHKVSMTTLEDLTPLTCFLIGVFQCFALWPGMSRSASTIVGGLLLGADRKVAAEFSFLVAVPVMVAAVAYDLLKSHLIVDASVIGLFAVGFITSFITAVLAIKVFLDLLNRWTLTPFGVYRIILAAIVGLVLL